LDRLRHIREQAGYSQQDLADESGVSQHTISELELGRRRPQGRTLRKMAKVLGVAVADLREDTDSLKAEAPPSKQLTLNGALEEEQRTAWEGAVDKARRLRETGWTQMWKALSEWRASKKRGEPYTARRKYLDEMGNLLQEAYDAQVALGQAYIEAALTQGGSEARVPSYLREQSRATTQFYGELRGLLRSAKLTVLTGDDAAAAKQATAEQAAAEHDQPEGRPRGVEENPAA
jgi:transcriptional regulator with XRE-family HTH domain